MHERRSILFLIPTLTGGGAERVIINLIRHIDRSRFKLTLAVVDTRKAAFVDAIPTDVDFVDLKSYRVRFALIKIILYVWQRRFHVVFSTLGHLNLAISIFLPILPKNIHYVARESSIVSEVIRNYKFPQIWGWAYRSFYHRFNAVICQSNFMKKDLIENYNLPETKAVVIYNPVDTNHIEKLAVKLVFTGMGHGIATNGKQIVRLITAGRIEAVKRFDLLIHAILLCDMPQLNLTILGEGSLRPELERLVIEKKISDQVRFVGFQQNPYPFFAQADVFVLSSLYEGLPNAVLEAIACCTPIIATLSPGGIKELIGDLEGCILVNGTTAEDLAEAIKNYPYGKKLSPEAIAPYRIASIIRHYEAILL